MTIDPTQYRILEALAACSKVATKSKKEDWTPEFENDLSARKSLLAIQADGADIPWALQNQTYYQAQTHPHEHNSVIISRAKRQCKME